MSQQSPMIRDFLATIPKPEEIRERLRETLRERQALRALLRLSLKHYPEASNHA